VNVLRSLDQREHITTMCFIVMPDHLHWLLQLGASGRLSRIINEVKSRSARRINASRGTRGMLWQRGYYDRAIRSDEDLPSIARYIVGNPIRAGLVTSVGQYPHWDASWI